MLSTSSGLNVMLKNEMIFPDIGREDQDCSCVN